jgi:hypothetical protein
MPVEATPPPPEPGLGHIPADDGTPPPDPGPFAGAVETPQVPAAVPPGVASAMGGAAMFWRPAGSLEPVAATWADPDGRAIPIEHFMPMVGLSSSTVATFRSFCRTHGLLREKFTPKQWSILLERNETRPVR